MKKPFNKEEEIVFFDARHDGYGGSIMRVVAVRQTDHSIYIKRKEPDWRGNLYDREKKESHYHHYFHTWDDAHKYLLEKATRVVAHKKQSLADAEKNLLHIQSMVKP